MSSLDDLVEVKLDDKQKGFLWAKLSPKSKAQIKAWVAEEIIGANESIVGPTHSSILYRNNLRAEQRKRLEES